MAIKHVRTNGKLNPEDDLSLTSNYMVKLMTKAGDSWMNSANSGQMS
jgi:hypothetical protein